ncbi:MAG: PilN domain-containing protein [Nitrospirae bacterium]|nr:MAG: PilN domain-containing protein [Nitrospirota bacterium]
MLGFGPPRYSLKLGPRQAAWAVRSTDWRRRTRVRSIVADLPSGLLRPSPVEPNISDVDALKSRLRALIGIPAGRQAPGWQIALVLSDLCVRTVLLNVDTLPSRLSERDALIRWRLEKEATFPVASARIVSQVVGPHTMLVVMIGESVLRQYETVCGDLGLVPVSVNATSFLLPNVARASSPVEEPSGWVSLLDEGFTFMIHRADRPVFVRTKTQSSQILGDLVASLAFYEETHPGTPLRRLYVLGEEQEPDAMTAISKELDLEVVPVGPILAQQAWRVPLDEATPPGALPAIAALAPRRRQAIPAVDLSGSHYAYLGPACAALVLVSLLLVGLIVGNVQEARTIRAQAMDVEQALARVQEQDRQVQLRGQMEGVDLSDTAMGRLTAQVVFANDLIAKRAFSWTRFLSDLEATVPPRVSINSIRLDFKDAVIAIAGSALSLKDLTTFIISLEDHRAFKDAQLLHHRVGDNDVVEFTLTVRYQSQAGGS